MDTRQMPILYVDLIRGDPRPEIYGGAITVDGIQNELRGDAHQRKVSRPVVHQLELAKQQV